MASSEDIKGMASFALEMVWPEFDTDNNGYLDKNEIDAMIAKS